MNRYQRALQGLSLLLLLGGGWFLGQGLYIEAKAWLSQVLIRQAWAETRQGGERVKPWSWADTWPVAELKVERLGVERVILAGASGRTLAFGPGSLLGSAAPGKPGNAVISGHRDTHFRFLKQLQIGDRLEVIDAEGGHFRYAVFRRSVRHQGDLGVLALQQDQLTLITCYPFDTLSTGGEQRYVVEAKPVLF
jgi:sortase A